MAVGIDMFGTGGEGLGGLFVGNQLAQQRDAAELERQKAMQDMANSQSIMRARDLETSFQEQVMPDRIGAEREKAAGIKAENDAKKLARTGEQFGQFGAMLEGVPALARPAVLKSMANQAGIGEDNPLYQALTQVDPAQLPATLNQMSQGFYEQSTAGRAEKLKAAERRETEREKSAAAMERAKEAADVRREIAAQASADRRFLGGLAAQTSRSNAATRAGGRSGGGLDKMTIDQRISYLETKGGVEGLSDGEQVALENLKQFKLNQGVVGKEETTAEIMGTRTPQERAQSMARGESSQQAGGGKPASKGNTKFQEGKVYQDASGNKARFENGKWVPIGAPAVPK